MNLILEGIGPAFSNEGKTFMSLWQERRRESMLHGDAANVAKQLASCYKRSHHQTESNQMTLNRGLPIAMSILTTVLFLSFLSDGFSQRKCCIMKPDANAETCRFDDSTLRFSGTPAEQAKCLLRHVKVRGQLDSAEPLPQPLEELVGTPVILDVERLKRYLAAHQISESEIGGDLRKPLSLIDSNNPRSERTRYFVIHDTSTPNYWSEIPNGIDEATWSGNNLSRVDRRLAHVYVNRLGQSVTTVDFQNVLPPTKFGTKFACCLGERHKGLFIHVELVEPRHCDPTHGRCAPYARGSNIASADSNDNLGPNPGFTKAQMDRLALLYVAASMRKHEWLIPSFHAPMDINIKDGHDDPQNFNLADWADSLKKLLVELR